MLQPYLSFLPYQCTAKYLCWPLFLELLIFTRMKLFQSVYLLIVIVISGRKCVLFQQNVINVDRIKCIVMGNMEIEMRF